MPAPLEDITVIEIDNWMAAPSAGAILADMGARVIKIEPLRGDPMRNNGRPAKVDGLSDYDFQFDVDNRGKESVCMDLTNPEAQKLVLKLCEKAEIFLCNLLLERQQKYQLDPATVMKSNPSIVHATLTGYGTSGPDAWRPGYDVTAFFGRSGLYDAMREGDHRYCTYGPSSSRGPYRWACSGGRYSRRPQSCGENRHRTGSRNLAI